MPSRVRSTELYSCCKFPRWNRLFLFLYFISLEDDESITGEYWIKVEISMDEVSFSSFTLPKETNL